MFDKPFLFFTREGDARFVRKLQPFVSEFMNFVFPYGTHSFLQNVSEDVPIFTDPDAKIDRFSFLYAQFSACFQVGHQKLFHEIVDHRHKVEHRIRLVI